MCLSECGVWMGFYLHVVHHHLVGQVGPELGLVDFLVEQRLETSHSRNMVKTNQFDC